MNMNSYYTFKEFSWNPDDLLACANAAKSIFRQYGIGIISMLEDDNAFGNLDVDAVLEEEYY